MADSLFEPQEVEAFARGLWMLASVDGEAHEAEQKLIREFIADTGNQITWDQVVADELGPRDVALALSTSFLRRVFMKAGAMALVTMGLSPALLRRSVYGLSLPQAARGKVLIVLFQRGAADALSVPAHLLKK